MSHHFKCSLGGCLEDDSNQIECKLNVQSYGWEPAEYNSTYKPLTHISIMDKEDLEANYDRKLVCDSQYSHQLSSAIELIWGDNTISENINVQTPGLFSCLILKSARASRSCHWEEITKSARVLGTYVSSVASQPPKYSIKYSDLQSAQIMPIEKQVVFRSSHEWRPCEYLSKLSCSIFK